MAQSLQSTITLLGGVIDYENTKESNTSYTVPNGSEEYKILKKMESMGLVKVKANFSGLTVLNVTDRGREFHAKATNDVIISECDRMSRVLKKDLDEDVFCSIVDQAERNISMGL